MKITALINNNTINQQLANYTLSLFEQTKTEVVDVTCETIEEISTKIEKSNLVILVMDETESSPHIFNKTVLQEKPILLLSTYSEQEDNTSEIAVILKDLKQCGNEVWGIFSLLNTKEAFNTEQEITNITLRLTLIRMINSIMYHNLGIRDNNKFSCGITPPKHYVGDSIGY